MSDDQLGIRITFADLPPAAASRAATELRRMIVDRADADVSIDKDDPDSQDAGSTLVLLFGSSAALAIAQGIKAFLAKRPAQHDGLTIKASDGTEIVATGETASKLDVPALVDALRRNHPKR